MMLIDGAYCEMPRADIHTYVHMRVARRTIQPTLQMWLQGAVIADYALYTCMMTCPKQGMCACLRIAPWASKNYVRCWRWGMVMKIAWVHLIWVFIRELVCMVSSVDGFGCHDLNYGVTIVNQYVVGDKMTF